jgi:alkylresorcinol/alkylpyrone synthase
MASITAVSTALPENTYDNADIVEAAGRWLGDDEDARLVFERFVSSSKVDTRHFVIPIDEVLGLNGARQRIACFEELGPELAVRGMRDALGQTRIDPKQVDVFITTSCTAPVIPALDTILIPRFGLSANVRRLPVYQHGCAGGVVGLSLAKSFADSGARVLLTSIECCSLVFQSSNHRKSNLVGSAIFGDGSASVLIEPGAASYSIVDTQSCLLPETRHLMGYDILDDGTHLRLDKELPSYLTKAVPELVREFLGRNGLTEKDVPWWLFHPGGAKILNFLEDAFALRPEQSCFARNALRKNGNLSSSAILFVLENFVAESNAPKGDKALILGVGPGLTIELVLVEV